MAFLYVHFGRYVDKETGRRPSRLSIVPVLQPTPIALSSRPYPSSFTSIDGPLELNAATGGLNWIALLDDRLSISCLLRTILK